MINHLLLLAFAFALFVASGSGIGALADAAPSTGSTESKRYALWWGSCCWREKGQPLPKFGEWDVNDPTSAEGFTVIFNKARDEKKTGGKPESPVKANSNIKHAADPVKPQAKYDFILSTSAWRIILNIY
ncbi:hypothetical protein F0562_030866 [Nyssa sinensis]|uniref:RIN4 pathogenic type III effector avirulence factor Avr cleavage site domain-containing protein n=1 Tax=Nyssa sinensis TaxID=561372 RepID=A0A5J5AZG2_9ASTE|nr:hypothetical protein F0562_030866 [Nyssa sinensis]